jgi:hypothetical protein
VRQPLVCRSHLRSPTGVLPAPFGPAGAEFRWVSTSPGQFEPIGEMHPVRRHPREVRWRVRAHFHERAGRRPKWGVEMDNDQVPSSLGSKTERREASLEFVGTGHREV